MYRFALLVCLAVAFQCTSSQVFAAAKKVRLEEEVPSQSLVSEGKSDFQEAAVFGIGKGDLSLVGTVLRVFEDGTAEVKWKTSNGSEVSWNLTYWHSSQLHKEVKTFKGFTQKQTVLGVTSGNHYVGEIQRLFENGVAEIRWKTANGSAVHWNLAYWNVSRLSSQLQRVKNMSVGQTVYGKSDKDYHLVGRVKALFQGDIAEVQWLTSNGQAVNWKPGYWPVSQLKPELNPQSQVEQKECERVQQNERKIVQENETCSICLNEFENAKKDLSYTPCGHPFHFKCLQGWMKNPNAVCPLCRGELTE